MADWSDLPKDLVRVVAELLLATNDVDWYVDMRAVCHNWRVAIPKPTPLGAGDDRRFRPREWVMLDEKEPEDGVNGRLFLHVTTGRFVRRPLPSFGFDMFSKYILVGASDGLLILGDQTGLHAARLLNPFTGDMLSFAAPIPRESWLIASVAGSGPMLLISFEDKCNNRVDMVYCADATSQLCEVQLEASKDEIFCLRKVVSFASDFYMVDYYGDIFKIVGTAPSFHGELIIKTFNDYRIFFLVESAGELLLVTRDVDNEMMEVFRINIEQKVLEPVRNIGSLALFLGSRCLSVDADKLPCVDSNCIYYTDNPTPFRGCNDVKRYDLSDNKMEGIPMVRPFSLAQTLLEYCVHAALEDIPSQLERVRQY